MSAAPPDFGPEDFARAANVSRETFSRLKAYAGLLAEWNARHNLVSARSLDEVWHRHFWDSAQLAPLIPADAKSLIDLGSGAGFPGLVLAIMRPELKVVLTDSIAKKCRFLEEVVARTSVSAEVRNARMESLAPARFDVVTARACAPLAMLLTYAQRFQGPATVNLFLKGQSVEVELTQARKSWRMQVVKHPSLTDPTGTILEVRELIYAAHRPTHRQGSRAR
jgi:16S rRNA (guanine527-N7)-methyltransferase